MSLRCRNVSLRLHTWDASFFAGSLLHRLSRIHFWTAKRWTKDIL